MKFGHAFGPSGTIFGHAIFKLTSGVRHTGFVRSRQPSGA
jgi:hypothetical protein